MAGTRRRAGAIDRGAERTKRPSSAKTQQQAAQLNKKSNGDWTISLVVVVMALAVAAAIALFLSNSNNNHRVAAAAGTEQTAVGRTPKPTASERDISIVLRGISRGDRATLRRFLNTFGGSQLSPVSTGQQRDNAPDALRIALDSDHRTILDRLDVTSSPPNQEPPDFAGIVADLVEHNITGSNWCSVYYAAQYRQLYALETLLSSNQLNPSTARQHLECVKEQDLNGDTAVHVAASGKASGFARLYMRLRALGKESVPALQQLGLRTVEGLLQADSLSRVQLEEAIMPRDLQILLEFISKWDTGQHSTAATRLRSAQDNTPLHLAALYGRSAETMRLLLEHDPESLLLTNDDKRTPLHLAAMMGHVDTTMALLATLEDKTIFSSTRGSDVLCMADTLQQTPCHWMTSSGIGELIDAAQHVCERAGCAVPEPAVRHGRLHAFRWQQQPSASHLVSETHLSGGGWFSDEHTVSRSCDVDVVEVDALSEDMLLQRYVRPHRPVLIRNGIKWYSAQAMEEWAFASFMKQHGDMLVTVADRPYESTYAGQGATTTRMSIREYANKALDPSQHSTRYVFDAGILHRRHQLYQQLPPPSFIAESTLLRQFILGPKGSGSPPHFHGHALNAVVYGLKKWALFPPQYAHFSFASHASQWFASKTHRTAKSSLGMLECQQGSGDVLFVPALWGHAVLNERPSIAVAYEFLDHPKEDGLS